MNKARFLSAIVIASAPLLGVAPAEAAPAAKAQIIGPIQISSGDPSVAFVKARYICQPGEGEQWLWVSAKQSATGRPDQALRAEGSSEAAAGWLQNHPLGEFTCDGTWQTDTFMINTDPDMVGQAGKGELRRGVAWVQFCLFDGQGNFINEYRWVPVH